MSVGDLRNNLHKLRQDLRTLKYPSEIDADLGDPAAFLPLIHHILLGSSDLLQQYLAESGIDLFAKSDRQFIGAVYKLLIVVFKYKPVLSQTQFFELGFAEHKVLFCLALIQMCGKKTNDLMRLAAAERTKKPRTQTPSQLPSQRVMTPTKQLNYDLPDMLGHDLRTNTSSASVRVFESPEMPPRLNSAHPFYAHVTENAKEEEIPGAAEAAGPSIGVVLRQMAQVRNIQNLTEMKKEMQQSKDEFAVFRENVQAHLTLLDNQVRLLTKQKSEDLLEYAMNRADSSA